MPRPVRPEQIGPDYLELWPDTGSERATQMV